MTSEPTPQPVWELTEAAMVSTLSQTQTAMRKGWNRVRLIRKFRKGFIASHAEFLEKIADESLWPVPGEIDYEKWNAVVEWLYAVAEAEELDTPIDEAKNSFAPPRAEYERLEQFYRAGGQS